MNLSEALNAALPDTPVHRRRDPYPRLDPGLVVKEQIENHEPVMMVFKRSSGNLYRFPPEIWELLQFFDGHRSHRQVAEDWVAAGGFAMSPDELRTYCDGLEESDFWYKSPQEKVAALNHKCHDDRRKHIQKKSKYGDVSHMQFSAWDPDAMLTAWHRYIEFMYTRWFTILTLCVFAFTAFIFFSNWGEIGTDTLKYYTFTDKSAADLLEFWLLFFGLGFFHESAHGLTCKHFGGEVHSMGFHLIYLTPAFFIDVSEVFVYGGKWQRVLSALAGIWVELMFCSMATIVWWGTAPGTFVHDFAYKVMLITGVAVIVVNVNPLIKLDGYFMFCEIFGTPEIKERSTSYLSTWVRRNIFRLPVDVEWVAKKQRPLFIAYAMLSGLYSYMLLLTVAKFIFHVFQHYNPEWAFVPGLGVGFLIFRSRIKNVVRFMKTLYLDKKERLLAWMTPTRAAALGAATLIILFAPAWPDFIEARFYVEPAHRAVLRATVPGQVESLPVREGQQVTAGETVATLRNLELESAAAKAHAEFLASNDRATGAQLRYADFGAADRDRIQARERDAMMQQQLARLDIRAPFSGTVITPRVEDKLDSYVDAGTVIAEIADTTSMRVRAYVPEFDMRKLRLGEQASLEMDSRFTPVRATVDGVAPVDSDIANGLMHKMDYKGLQPPKYYQATLTLTNDKGVFKDGMTGTAKILAGRQSLVGIVWQQAREFTSRKIW